MGSSGLWNRTRKWVLRLLVLLLLCISAVLLWALSRDGENGEPEPAPSRPTEVEAIATIPEETVTQPPSLTQLAPTVTQPPSTTRSTTRKKTTKKPTTTLKNTKKVLNVPHISQRDRYPTGCESVSAVMAMQYAGISISVDKFINQYLDLGIAPSPRPDGVWEGSDPRKAFLGDPTSPNGWGCWSPVITKAMKKAVNGKKYRVTELSGVSLSDLCKKYIDKDIPVLVWATQQMAPVRMGRTYQITGSKDTFTWRTPLHCLVLVGYDETRYYFNDPMEGKQKSYPKAAVAEAYRGMGYQAVVLQKK